MTFRERLLKAQKRGHLSVADLARWFERSYSVVWYWTTEDRRTRVGEADREARLKLLEKTVAKGASAREYKLVLKHDTPRGGAKVRGSSGLTIAEATLLSDKRAGVNLYRSPKKR